VAEVLGAFGLVLPGLLRIRQGLTPLAAAGLVIIMIGATVVMWVGRYGCGGADERESWRSLLRSSPTVAGGWRRIATCPAVGAPARKLSTKQPSRKEQTMSTGGFSKTRLGRMHDVMGFFCGLTVGLTLVATPAGIARNVIESMPSSSRLALVGTARLAMKVL